MAEALLERGAASPPAGGPASGAEGHGRPHDPTIGSACASRPPARNDVPSRKEHCEPLPLAESPPLPAGIAARGAGASRLERPAGLGRLALRLFRDELVSPLIEALLPADCPGCALPLPGVSWSGLCDGCWRRIEPARSPLCPMCGIPYPSLIESERADDRPCGRCLDRPPAFDGARCALVFDGPVRALLHLFKFDNRRDLAKVLARSIVEALPRDEEFDLIVPVPLHWTRRLKRGYNQAALLARLVARAKGAPLARRLLVKRRRTADQTELDAAARRRNVRGAFVVRADGGRAALSFALPRRARGPRSPVSGLRILLVDDVLTTGATADECARVLKEAGAGRVFVGAVARTPAGRTTL